MQPLSATLEPAAPSNNKGSMDELNSNMALPVLQAHLVGSAVFGQLPEAVPCSASCSAALFLPCCLHD